MKTLPILFLALILLLPITPAFANEVDIDVNTDDDLLAVVGLTGDTVNATVTINGVDVLDDGSDDSARYTLGVTYGSGFSYSGWWVEGQ